MGKLFNLQLILVSIVVVGLLGCTTRDPVLPEGTSVKSIGREFTFEEKVALQEEIIKRQEEELARQQREIEDLKRQKYHNDSLRRYEK